MALSNSPTFVVTPKVTPQSWTNSDSANTKKTIATAGSDGAKVVAIIAATTDSTARVFKIYSNRSSTSYQITAGTVAITSGTDGTTPTTDLLALCSGLPTDNDGQRYLHLESGDILQAENVTQVTSGKQTDIHVIFGNF